MKTYVTPEMNLIVYTADQTIAADGSNLHNDVELAW